MTRASFILGSALALCAAPLLAHTADTVSASDAPQFEVPDLATHHAAAKPWTSLAVKDGAERFSFAVFGDNTGDEQPGVFEEGVRKVNMLQPAFVMSIGDFIEGPSRAEENLSGQWDRFQSWVAKLDEPFFYTPGNHDIQNVESEREWKERFGASYYHMRYKDTLFLVLNAEYLAFDGGLDQPVDADVRGRNVWRTSAHVAQQRAAMLDYVQHVLDANKDVRWTFVFMHKPLWDPDFVWPRKGPGKPRADGKPANPGWRKVEAMLADRDYTVLAGHNHDYMWDDVSDGKHTHQRIIMASTGGGSDMRGLAYGEFQHFLWVTMTKDGPVFANLLLDGVQPRDLRVATHPDASAPQSPES